MHKEGLLSQEPTAEGKAVYTSNLEGIIFVGMVDFPLEGEKKDFLRMDGFNLGMFGNKIFCTREQFPEVAHRIAEAKKALENGNRQPFFKLIMDYCFVTRDSVDAK